MINKIIVVSLCFLTSFLNAQVSITNYTIEDGLISNNTSSIYADSDDVIWIGTQRGVSRFDGSTWMSYNADDGLVDDNVKAIYVDVLGNVWAGTDFGLSKFDGLDWTTFIAENNGLEDNRIRYISGDDNGNLFVGHNDGFSRFDGSTWLNITRNDGLPFGGVDYIYEGDDGNIYLGTPLGGVYILDENYGLSSITEDDGLLSNKVRGIAIDEEENKWIATADGISVFDKDNEFITHHEIIFILPPPDELNPLEDIKIDSKGTIWAGVYVDYLVTEGGVSYYGDNMNWGDYDVNDGLVGPVVRKLAIDSRDIVWVATSTGISRIGDFTNSTTFLKNEGQIKISPNPSNDLINVEVPLNLIGEQIKILNIMGQVLYEDRVENISKSIYVNHFANGMYLLNVGNKYVKKFVIKK